MLRKLIYCLAVLPTLFGSAIAGKPEKPCVTPFGDNDIISIQDVAALIDKGAKKRVLFFPKGLVPASATLKDSDPLAASVRLGSVVKVIQPITLEPGQTVYYSNGHFIPEETWNRLQPANRNAKMPFCLVTVPMGYRGKVTPPDALMVVQMSSKVENSASFTLQNGNITFLATCVSDNTFSVGDFNNAIGAAIQLRGVTSKDLPIDDPLNYRAPFPVTLRPALNLALEYAERTITNDAVRKSPYFASLFALRTALRNTEIKLAEPGYPDFRPCREDPRRLAFYDRNSDATYVCRPALEQSPEVLAQTLISVTTRAAGWHGEDKLCEGTWLELITVIVGGGTPITHKAIIDCGFLPALNKSARNTAEQLYTGGKPEPLSIAGIGTISNYAPAHAEDVPKEILERVVRLENNERFLRRFEGRWAAIYKEPKKLLKKPAVVKVSVELLDLKSEVFEMTIHTDPALQSIFNIGERFRCYPTMDGLLGCDGTGAYERVQLQAALGGSGEDSRLLVMVSRTKDGNPLNPGMLGFSASGIDGRNQSLTRGGSSWSQLGKVLQEDLKTRLTNLNSLRETTERNNQLPRTKALQSYRAWLTSAHPESNRPDNPPDMTYYPEWFFDHALGVQERQTLLYVYAKLKHEGLWNYVATVTAVENNIGGSIYFTVAPSDTALTAYLKKHGYGSWWLPAIADGGKWRWGLRYKEQGSQLHFRGDPSGLVQAHVDLNAPGQEIPILSLFNAWGALHHMDQDLINRDKTHTTNKVAGGLEKSGIRLP